MMTLTCPQMAELADELAVDALPGDLRAAAIDHLEHCSPCRAIVESLAETADELLAASPLLDPPAGFTDRVLVRLESEQRPVRRWRHRPRLAVAAAAVLVLAVGAGAFGLAGSLRSTGNHNVAELGTARLISATGDAVGSVSRYSGHPGWIFMRVDRAGDSGTDRCVVVLKDGATIPLGTIALTNGRGAWGQNLSVDPGLIRTARLVSVSGVTVATAAFPTR